MMPASHRANPAAKILLIGPTGQVGWELLRTLQPLGTIIPAGRQPYPFGLGTTLDLGHPEGLRPVLRELKPRIIVNAAAYTAVDRAEEEPDLALAVNDTAPGVLAEEAERLDALLIHYSTDYVFDGTKGAPYTEEDGPCPLNVYGQTKLAGERAIQAAGARHFILRTSWVYGRRGTNFLLTILRLAAECDELRIVADQVGSPTWSRLVAEATAQVVASHLCGAAPAPGIYHVSAGGQTSWHGFAQAIVEEVRARASRPLADKAALPAPRLGPSQVLAITTAEFPRPARRPAYSVLANDRLRRDFHLALPDWRLQLHLALDE